MLTEPFIFHPENRPFLTGARRGIVAGPSRPVNTVLAYGCFLFPLMSALFVAGIVALARELSAEEVSGEGVRNAAVLTLFAAFPGLVVPVLWALGRYGRGVWLRRRLARRGQFRDGEVVSCRVEEYGVPYGEVESRREYLLTLGYRFLTPGEKETRGESTRVLQHPPAPSQVPAAGTPVRLLYLHERRYQVL